mgnify:CR=1 FL=1
MYFFNHSADCRGVLMCDRVVHLAETQCVQCAFLHCGAIDAAFDLFDFYLCHLPGLFTVKHFLYTHATVLGHLGR